MDELLTIRVRLQGGRATEVELKGVAGAVRDVGATTAVTSRNMERGNRSSFLYQQGLFTVRRGAYAATLALGALGTAAVVSGIRFNASMESSTIVMSQFLGSTSSATRELKLLFNLAAHTPFTFSGITSAATQLFSLGFNLKETNRMLGDFADLAAGRQLDSSALASIAIIFGQIRSSGRLLGQDLRQLQQVGLPTSKILQQQLGLSQKQVESFMAGSLSIPSGPGIEALLRGIEASPTQGGFGGLANRLQGTFTALKSTAQDYATMLFGAVTQPLFLRIEAFMKTRLNPVLTSMVQAFQTGGWDQMIATLDESVGAGGRIVRVFEDFRDVLLAVYRITTRVLLPALVVWWDTVEPILRPFVALLRLAGEHTGVLRVALVALTVISAAPLAPLVLLGLAFRGIGAAVTALGRAVTKVKRVFVDAFDWVQQHWRLLAVILAGPIGALGLVADRFQHIWGWVKRIAEYVAKPFRIVFDFAFHLPHKPGGWFGRLLDVWSVTNPVGLSARAIAAAATGDPGKLIPQPRAMGGPVFAGSPYIVGERAPELFIPSVSGRIQPLQMGGRPYASPTPVRALDSPQPVMGARTAAGGPMVVEVYTDSELIARMVAKHAGVVGEGVARYKAKLGARG